MPKSHQKCSHEMRLYDTRNRRLYINATERAAFLKAANAAPLYIKAFCLTLLYTGCRLSEARELKSSSLQAAEGVLAIRSLKKRSQHKIREIPIPSELVVCLLQHIAASSNTTYIWAEKGQMVHRITSYRWIKSIMREIGITGAQACPKGLRHGYGVHAVCNGVALNMLQRWMGHTSMETTAIYANAVGAEERVIARRMW